MWEKVRSMQRRSFMLALATGAFAAVFRNGVAHAVQKPVPPGTPALDPEDAQAKALSYTPDVADVDSEALNLKTAPAAAGQNCGNCQLFSGTPGAEWGPCAVFSYRTDPKTRQNLVVSADGWCKAWAPRAA
jgi:hypothetical protein